MNDPLQKFKVLVVHSWPAGGFPHMRRQPVASVGAAAVYIVDLLCQGFRAGHLGNELHVFHPSALGTVPLQIWEGFTVLEAGPAPGPGEPVRFIGWVLAGPSHGPNPSQSVPTTGIDGSKVVPIDAARLARGTRRGRQ